MDLKEGDKFASFIEFMDKFDKLQKSSLTQFTKVSSERLQESDDLFEQFRYRVIRYQCKQGQRLRETTSKQQRPCQRSYKVGCPVMMNVRLNRPKGKDAFLRVTKLTMEHDGHEVSENMFHLYPEQRRIVADDIDHTVLSAVTMKVSEQRQILEQRHGNAVMTQDIYNLQRQLGVGKGNGGRDDVKCEEIVRDVISKGGCGEVGKDDKGDFVYVAFMTKSMRFLLLNHPECFVMDCTYKVNNYLYPLLTIMIIDGEGHGMPVFHAFLAKEDKHIMGKCLRFFAQQFNTGDARCFIVDKDMAEMAAIESVFPGVPVNLCHFHISQAVERYLRKELGRTDLLNLVHTNFMAQVTTESEVEFEEIRHSICQLLPTAVIDYFERHWWAKRHLWAACSNINVSKFHATTTNTLESYHSKIKKVIDEKQCLSNVLSALLSFDESKIVDRQRKQILTSNSYVYDVSDKDLVSKEITKTMTRFGGLIVKQELSLSQSVLYDLSESSTESTFMVSYKDRQHLSSATSCTCSTFGNFSVPCRHIFFVRKHLGVDIFDIGLIPDRFKQSAVPRVISCPFASELFVETVQPVPVSLRTFDGRFNAAKEVCDEIASFLSVVGVDEFRQKLQELKDLIARWSVSPVVASVSSVPSPAVEASVDVLSVPPPVDVSVDVVSSVPSPVDVSVDVVSSVPSPVDVSVDVSSVPSPVDVSVDVVSSVPSPVDVSVDVVSSVPSPVDASVDVVSSVPSPVDASVDVVSSVPSPVDVSVDVVSSVPSPVDVSVDVVSSVPSPVDVSVDVVSSVSSPVDASVDVVLSVPSPVPSSYPSVASTDHSTWPSMSRLINPRGRPGGKRRFPRLSTTKRCRVIPKVFSGLSEVETVCLLLNSVTVSHYDHLPTTLIQSDDLRHFTKFQDTIMDEKVDLSCVQKFFEPSAWELVVDGVEHRGEAGIFTCGSCREYDQGELKMVQCEHCLVWFHFQCVNYSSRRTVLLWFCEDCM